jgi:hypothetical protein
MLPRARSTTFKSLIAHARIALTAILLLTTPRMAHGQQEGVAASPSTADLQMKAPVLEPATAKPSRFRDSTFVWFHNVGAMGLVKSSELSWNPVYSWLFRVYPRLYLTDKLSLRLKAGLGIEWTNADDTNKRHEARWEDVWFDVVYSPLVQIPRAKIDITPSLRFVLPTSKEARASSLYLGIGPGVTFKRAFSLPRGMGATLAYSFRFTKNLTHYTTMQYQAPTILGCGALADVNGNGCDALLHSGVRVTDYHFLNNLLAELAFSERFKVSAMVAFIHNHLYDLTTAKIPLAGGESVTLGADPQNNTRYRSSIWYLIEAEVQVHPVLALSAGISTFSPQLAQDSTRERPFVNRYTELVFSMTVALDQAAGRAKNALSASETHAGN